MEKPTAVTCGATGNRISRPLSRPSLTARRPRAGAPAPAAPKVRDPRPNPPDGPFLIAGLQRAGRSTAHALLETHGPGSVVGWDSAVTRRTEAAREELESQGVRVELGGDGTSLLEGFPGPRCVVKSPGIPFTVPLIRVAETLGIEVIDELELGWRRCSAPIVAVTGTNGKSTTAALIKSVLDAAGAEPRLTGNTPFGPALSGLERDAEGVVVCEVSSFQLEGCPAFLPDAAVLTSLSAEHLDRHGTMERYAACKARMFVNGDRAVPLAAVNTDLPLGRRLIAELDPREGRAVGFGEGEGADYRLERLRSSLTGSSVTIGTPSGPTRLDTRLPGPHNALNVTAALALCDSMGLDRRSIEEAISTFPGVPGRFELVDGPQPFSVVVDFAHNEAGVRAVVRTAREVLARRPEGRLRAVVSAASFFDTPQRLAIGRAARESTDQLILTSDRWPGDPPGISEELLAGAGQVEGADLRVVEDRRAAIEAALRSAAPRDVVLILGRGAAAAPMLDPAGRESPFDDREIAGELLCEMASAAA